MATDQINIHEIHGVITEMVNSLLAWLSEKAADAAATVSEIAQWEPI